MSTFVIAYLAASAVFIAAFLAANRVGLGTAWKPLDVSACSERLFEIDQKVRAGTMPEDQAASARIEIIRGLLASDREQRRGTAPFRRSALALTGAGSLLVAFLIVQWTPQASTGSGQATLSRAGSADEVFARLRDYADQVSPDASAPMSRWENASQPALPDVDTMIRRLAARLENAPDDVEGWRMLGWSYFNTGRFAEAAKAYERALALDPSSDEMSAALEEAKAKAEGEAATHPESAGADATVVRSMVDRLASRLEASPNDPEGWKRLIRSRAVLGEKEAASLALRKALELFKHEPAQMTGIQTLASELGLAGK